MKHRHNFCCYKNLAVIVLSLMLIIVAATYLVFMLGGKYALIGKELKKISDKKVDFCNNPCRVWVPYCYNDNQYVREVLLKEGVLVC